MPCPTRTGPALSPGERGAEACGDRVRLDTLRSVRGRSPRPTPQAKHPERPARRTGSRTAGGKPLRSGNGVPWCGERSPGPRPAPERLTNGQTRAGTGKLAATARPLTPGLALRRRSPTRTDTRQREGGGEMRCGAGRGPARPRPARPHRRRGPHCPALQAAARPAQPAEPTKSGSPWRGLTAGTTGRL